MTSGLTALVTGANRGIGRQVAGRLHELGYRVVVAGRQKSAAVVVAAELGDPAVGVALDVTDAGSVDRARKEVGQVDVLVNNAGVLLDDQTPVTSADPACFSEHFAVNTLGALRVTQAFLPAMLERAWGRVVMLSSHNGRLRGVQLKAPAYSVSKAALNAVTVLLAKQVLNSGVLINAVCPGRVHTRMLPTGEQTPERAAEGVVYVATLPDDGGTGQLFLHSHPIEW